MPFHGPRPSVPSLNATNGPMFLLVGVKLGELRPYEARKLLISRGEKLCVSESVMLAERLTSTAPLPTRLELMNASPEVEVASTTPPRTNMLSFCVRLKSKRPENARESVVFAAEFDTVPVGDDTPPKLENSALEVAFVIPATSAGLGTLAITAAPEPRTLISS